MAEETDGKFYLALEAANLPEIYDDINNKIDIETDSDEDGISDYYEENMVLFNGVTIKLDKNNPDSDNDGLLDGEEVAELNYQYNEDKTKVIVTGKIFTNPVEPDSDLDGLTDEEEIYVYGTNPLMRDTDGDGLNDYLEIEIGFNPIEKDEDGDGRSDLREYLDGTKPDVYDRDWYEYTWDFLLGVVGGDIIRYPNLAQLMGQIVGSFIPLVDIRDVIANIAYGDYVLAGFSAVGLVPAGGDAVKAASKIGKYIVAHMDEAAEIVTLLKFTVLNYPELLPLLKNIDGFEDSLKQFVKNNADKLSKSQIDDFNEAVIKADLPECAIKSGVKSGKELIKNIRKVEYGSDELSKVAIEFRKANKITSAHRNICVVEYKCADGTVMKKAFVSKSDKHSEEIMIEYLEQEGISGKNVINIFSEREPCVQTVTNVGHNCTSKIMEYSPEAAVTYSVDYGVTRESGVEARNILRELLSKVLD